MLAQAITNTDVKIQFLGAAGTVTGSKYLIQYKSKNILVDCGLFQGLKDLRLLNWEHLPVNISDIDYVLLTHGHLDHCGYLPRLVKDGFDKPVWCTAPTAEITKIILEDSARIQEEDAERANKEKFSKHHPALPLYTSEDVENTLRLIQVQPLGSWIKIDENISCKFRYNGHILGACFIELKLDSRIIVFSGDIGRENDIMLHAPEKPDEADIVLIESTYGNRFHKENTSQQLVSVINEALKRNGTIIIPSFAVERTQLLMYLLWRLRKTGSIPNIPVYMDSPMGTSALEVFKNHPSWHKLSAEECSEMCSEIKLIKKIKETYQLAASEHSKIIIAGSGMATGGRVLTYFMQYLGNPSATILFAGYQAEGTRGRALIEGAKEIKLYGKYFPVKAHIEIIEGLSAHADQHELISWLSALKKTPGEIFIIHGENDAAIALKNKIKEVYGWNAAIPRLNQECEI